MTAPTTTLGRPPDQDQVDAQTLAYEQTLEALAVGGLLTALAGIAAVAAMRLQLRLTLGAWLAAELRGIRVDAAERVRAQVLAGMRLGAVRAADDAGLADLPALALDADTAAVVDGMDAHAEQALQDAARLAEALPLNTAQDVDTVMAKAMTAANVVKADARWVANHAANAGTAAVAAASGDKLVWIAERGACLVCLALSGQVVDPGGVFDGALTFGAKPMPLFPVRDPVPLLHPPRHPGCRCGLRLWRPGDSDLPTVLKREAQRSVARGFSNYASRPARLRASKRLLTHRSLLPASVLARTRRDVDRGNFSPRHNQLLPGVPAGR